MSAQFCEVVYLLTSMYELFFALIHFQDFTIYLFLIVFMILFSFVIFLFYIFLLHKFSLFTKILYLISFFALVVPFTIIIILYLSNTLLSFYLSYPIMPIAFILLIPVTTSYILMIVKYRRDTPRPQ